MPRLFSGLELPADIRMRLGLMRGQVGGAKWIAPEDMHITLRFLGDVDQRTGDEFADLIAAIAEEPFEVAIKGLGSFGGRAPRAIWAGVEHDGAIERLARAHERAARLAGLGAEAREFTAHVTLARLKSARPEPVARFLEEQGDFAPMRFEVSRVVLFSARPGSGGGPYAVEEAFPLGATGEDEDWQ
jgi:2'-5' RNA ligase